MELNDIEPSRLNPSSLTKHSRWNDFKFWLVLHNPCYTSGWYTKILFKLFDTGACMCCSLSRAFIVGFFLGMIYLGAAIKIFFL